MNAQQTVNAFTEISNDIQTHERRIIKVIPEQSGLKPIQLLGQFKAAFDANPKLYECDKTSLFNSFMLCAMLGLSANPQMQQVAFIPFWNGRRGISECKFIPMYQGLIDLAFQSDLVADADAFLVYDGDFFQYTGGTDMKIVHPGPWNTQNPITHAYAIINTTRGGKIQEVMDRYQIETIRDRSPNYRKQEQRDNKENPWNAHEGEMFRKTVLKRALKKVPKKSHSLSRAIAIDNAVESGATIVMGDDDFHIDEPPPQPAAITTSASVLDQFMDITEPLRAINNMLVDNKIPMEVFQARTGYNSPEEIKDHQAAEMAKAQLVGYLAEQES